MDARTPVVRPVVRVVSSDRPLDVRTTLASLRHGPSDPAYRVGPDGSVWWAARTPAGAVTVRLCQSGRRGVAATAWGPGADWAGERMPELVGEHDDWTGFIAHHPVVASSQHRRPGWRMARTGLVLRSLVPVVLEQKVTGKEAHRSWRELLGRFGEPAPGPAPPGMRLPPTDEGWRSIPSWEWHRAGVGPQRADTVQRAVRLAGRLEASAASGSAALDAALRSIPGIGVWTSAEVRQRVLGDPDAVSVGDYHLPAVVGWALAGRRTDDAGMLKLLEPYRGHRARAVRLVELAGGAARPPRRGPRMPVRDYRAV